jgi:VanZ family protein
MNLQRVWWTLGALLVAIALVVCIVPVSDVPSPFEWNDKTSHLVGHGTLAIYFAGLVPRRAWWKIFVFLLLFGIAVEFAQHFMQLGREGDPRDVVANSAGAALGLLAARLGLSRWPELAAWLLGRRATQ